MSSPEMPSDTPSGGGRKRPSLRTVGAAVVLVAGGALAGGILAGTLVASAATSPSPSPSTPSTTAPNTNPTSPRGHLPLTGTVTAVGTDTVTIKTSAGTTTYSFTADSDIDKNGEAKLSDLKVGDAVMFNTTTEGGTVIAHLHAGDEALNRPPGCPGGPGGHRGGGLALTGTVTAVGSNTVTIKTSAGTTTYSVTTDSDIDKNGDAKLSDLKVGDAVRFDTTTQGGTVIGHLHAGDEALNRPGRGPGGPGAPGAPGGSTTPSTGAAFTGTNA
jgi:Cu/Ag efflux protein CusF